MTPLPALLAALMAIQGPSPSSQFEPLNGQWEGSWTINRGLDVLTGTFRLTFASSPDGPKGQFVDTQKKPSRQKKIERIERTTNSPSYRWYVDGDCWNVEIANGRMTGIRNGGACSSAGVGSAGRLIPIEAKKK
jgi:hypothetical protein